MINTISTKHTRTMTRAIHALWHRAFSLKASLVDPYTAVLDVFVEVHSRCTYTAYGVCVSRHAVQMPPIIAIEYGTR